MQTSNAVVAAKPIDRFKLELSAREDHLRKLLPSTMGIDKFQAIVVAAVADNMDLLDVDRGSLLKACLSAAELGLSLNKSMAEADILKVWDGKLKKNVAQFRPRYKGLMKLALQGGEVLKIESRLVYENDTFEVEEGIDPRIIHKHGLGNRGEKIGAYCVWKLRNGETQFEVMSKEEILAIRERSSAKMKDGTIVGPWKTDEAEMWRKTVVRRATKYMPLSTEAQRAVYADNKAEGIVDIEGDDYEGDEMDITDFALDPEPAEAQVSTLEEKIAARTSAPKPELHIDVLVPEEDAEGMTDWDSWCRTAIEILKTLTPDERRRWKDAHQEMLDEAELMAHKTTSVLLKMFN